MRYRKGKDYKITFLDHCCSDNKPMLCSVLGTVIESHKEYVVLSHWVTHTDCEETYKHNLELTVILKAVIKESRQL